MGDLLKNIATFGAHGRVQRKQEELSKEIEKLKELTKVLEEKADEANTSLEALVNTKIHAIYCLNQLKKLSKNIRTKDRKIENIYINGKIINLDKINIIEDTITSFEAVKNLSKGAGSGITTAIGVWALAESIGTASTGTAISTLSGAAATNATLAWLGGGSIAAGGGGVAAGTIVLGGFVILPTLVIAGLFNHVSANKKINEIEEQLLKVINQEDYAKQQILFVELTKKRADEIILAIEKSCETFMIELKKAKKKIYPIPLVSRAIKWLRKQFGYEYFSSDEVELISYIGQLGVSIVKLIDTKIFEKDDSLSKDKIEKEV